MSVPDPSSVTKPGEVDRTVLLAVTLSAPPGYSDADLNDVVAFHLGTTDLNMLEADISAVTIIGSKMSVIDPMVAQLAVMEDISPAHRAVTMSGRAAIIACVDHDLAGPTQAGVVYATCSKCSARFKVRVDG